MPATSPIVHSSALPPRDGFRTLNAVRGAHLVTGPDRAVLWALASRATGWSGEAAYPSQPLIAVESGVKLRTVANALTRLESEGVIRRGDQSLAPRPRRGGKPVVVWDVAVEVLEASAKSCKCSFCDDSEPEKPAPGKPPSASQHASGAGSNLHLTAPQPAPNADEVPRNYPLELPTKAAAPTPAASQATTSDDDLVADARRHLAEISGDVKAKAHQRRDPLDLLLGALAARPAPIADPLAWLVARLAAVKGDDVFGSHHNRKQLVRSLWLSDVAQHDEAADEALLTDRLTADGIYDEVGAAEVAADMRASGVRSPGLYLLAASDTGAVAVVDRFQCATEPKSPSKWEGPCAVHAANPWDCTRDCAPLAAVS